MKYCVPLILSSILLFSAKQPNLPVDEKVSDNDTLIYTVSAKILGDNYRADYKSNGMLYVINKSDTLIAQNEEGLSPIPLKFEDYNRDGLLDIRYGYNSNYFYETILLFDLKNKNFKKIEDIDNSEYACSKKIKNTNLYYSYSPNGCGKNNWISHLFSIIDYRVHPKGVMEYRQCSGDKKGLYIFKIRNSKKILIDEIVLKTADKIKLETLWKKYLKNFTKP